MSFAVGGSHMLTQLGLERRPDVFTTVLMSPCPQSASQSLYGSL